MRILYVSSLWAIEAVVVMARKRVVRAVVRRVSFIV
jgi:hypothetical protein